MNKNQEKIKQALDRIESCLAAVNTDEDWLKFLSFQSLFYNYSFGNAMLIYSQNPEASYVKGYKAWNELGRYVKRGSKGLAILAPCFKKVEVFKEPEDKAVYQDAEGEKETKRIVSGFRVTYVYDIADTDGSDEYLPVLVKGLAGNSEEEKEIYDRLLAFISTEHTVKEVTGTASEGSYNLETGVICVRTDLEYLQKIKTLLHEYAHAIDFKMHPEPDCHASNYSSHLRQIYRRLNSATPLHYLYLRAVFYGTFFSVLLTILFDSLIVSFATENKKRKNSPDQSSFFLSTTSAVSRFLAGSMS